MNKKFIHCKPKEWTEHGTFDDDCWTFRSDLMCTEITGRLNNKYSQRPITDLEIVAKSGFIRQAKQTEIHIKELLEK